MDDLDTDRLLHDYVDRYPAAQKALVGDPAFQFQMESLRRTIDLLVPALRREGLDPLACKRVVDTILYGSPDPDAALERIADHQAKVEILRLTGPPVRFDEETARQLLEGEWLE